MAANLGIYRDAVYRRIARSRMGRFRKFQGREGVDETFRPESADKAKKVKHM